jgi:hypothetical protein
MAAEKLPVVDQLRLLIEELGRLPVRIQIGLKVAPVSRTQCCPGVVLRNLFVLPPVVALRSRQWGESQQGG